MNLIRLVAPTVLLLALLVCGCGGSGTGRSDQTAVPAASATTTAKPLADDSRKVTARVGSRKLVGSCVGAQRDEPEVVAESGIGGGPAFTDLENHLKARTVVCEYQRAGTGASDPPTTTPRHLDEVVSDLDAFIVAAKLATPVVLVGHSAGPASPSCTPRRIPNASPVSSR